MSFEDELAILQQFGISIDDYIFITINVDDMDGISSSDAGIQVDGPSHWRRPPFSELPTGLKTLSNLQIQMSVHA